MVNVIEIEGMNDLIQAIENGGGGGGGTNVPEPTSADRGKFLGVSTDSNDLEYREVNQVPNATASAVGKVLTVDSNGAARWDSIPPELPRYTSSDVNKVLTVGSSGTPEWAAASGGATVNSYTVPFSAGSNKRSVYSQEIDPNKVLNVIGVMQWQNENGYDVTSKFYMNNYVSFDTDSTAEYDVLDYISIPINIDDANWLTYLKNNYGDKFTEGGTFVSLTVTINYLS